MLNVFGLFKRQKWSFMIYIILRGLNWTVKLNYTVSVPIRFEPEVGGSIKPILKYQEKKNQKNYLDYSEKLN